MFTDDGNATACSPTTVTLHDTQFVECRWWNDGWTKNCRHLKVVGLHVTGSRSGRRAEAHGSLLRDNTEQWWSLTSQSVVTGSLNLLVLIKQLGHQSLICLCLCLCLRLSVCLSVSLSLSHWMRPGARCYLSIYLCAFHMD